MTQRYRAAIVGLGNIAWRLGGRGGASTQCLTHADAFVGHPLVTLVGGCSPMAKERVDFSSFFDVSSFASMEELIEETRPEIVSICSPSEFHYEQVRCCLENDVPMIWLEKPPAGSIQELDALIALQRQSRSVVLVNYQRRYTECYQALKRLYQEKSLGACPLVQINYSRGLETNGSHLLDQLFFVVGDHVTWRVDWVSSLGGAANPCCAVSIENGPQVMVSGLDLSYHCIDISLICEDGRVSVLHGGMTPVCEQRVEHELYPGFYRLRTIDNALLGPCNIEMSMANALRDLIAAHEEGRQPRSSLKTARNSQLLMAEIRRKQGEGRE